MADVTIVAKAMNDLADDWHWVVLVDASVVEPRVFRTSRVRTRISDVPRVVRLFDMGAPDEPTCPKCLEGGLDAGLRAQISEVLRQAEEAPAGVS
jgi:hypothetical protein